MNLDQLNDWFDHPVTKQFVEHCYNVAEKASPPAFKTGMSMDDFAAAQLDHGGYTRGLAEFVTFFRKHKAPLQSTQDKKDQLRSEAREKEAKSNPSKLSILKYDKDW